MGSSTFLTLQETRINLEGVEAFRYTLFSVQFLKVSYI